jgi:hypothetical protein
VSTLISCFSFEKYAGIDYYVNRLQNINNQFFFFKALLTTEGVPIQSLLKPLFYLFLIEMNFKNKSLNKKRFSMSPFFFFFKKKKRKT